jgi:hypothetical protein
MIIYNITTQVGRHLHDAWRQWLMEEYLPSIMATGLFSRYQLVRIMEINEEEGHMYAVQLYSDDHTKLDDFRNNFLHDIQKKEKIKWGDGTFSFGSVMEVIN